MEKVIDAPVFVIDRQHCGYENPAFEPDENEIDRHVDSPRCLSNEYLESGIPKFGSQSFYKVTDFDSKRRLSLDSRMEEEERGERSPLKKLHPGVRVVTIDHACYSEPDLVQKNHALVNNMNDDPANGQILGVSPMLHTHRSAPQLSNLTVHLEEVAPPSTEIHDGHEWTFPIDWFTSKKRGKTKEDCNLPKSVRHYYKAQDELITAFETIRAANEEDADDVIKRKQSNYRLANILAKVTFLLNLVLLVAKLVASILSGSLSIISSLVDSAVDLVSGIIIWWTNRAIKKRDPYTYPEGRTKLEPLGIVVLSVIMSVAAVQLVIVSVERIVDFATAKTKNTVVMDIATIVIVVFTIVSKLVMFLLCRRVPVPSTEALALDHRNDVLSNFVALVMGLVGSYWWKYADPIGAVLISLYIAFSWYQQGWQQIKMLTGVTARPEFLKKITWICLDHSSKIQHIDTVRAFHFGTNFIVEVDIVLPETMTLKEAHDIGEPLQQKLEKLTEVERAFVHLDYEFEHSPYDEHKHV